MYGNMKENLFGLWIMAASMASAQIITPVNGKDALLSGYTTSWIANEGGYEEAHIPHDMLGMYVGSDGTAATVCGWDEGGTNVAVFRDGKLLSRPEGSGTGGWGRFSHLCVVLDEQYVYHLLSQHGCDGGNNELNMNGLRQFPPCDETREWKTIRRYDVLTGKGAPFKGGYGYRGDMLVVATERFRSLEGLALSDGHLVVAIGGGKDHQMPDSVKVYDKRTMTFVCGWPVKGGIGQICADGEGCIWMYQGRRIVRMEKLTGRLKPQRVNLPEDVIATTCCVDIKGKRLLIPDHGRDLDIRIYTDIYRQPRFSGTFGTKGGVFARTGGYLQGEAGPLRFSGPRAVGVDGRGNICVANQTVSGGRGAVIEAYRERDGHQLWKQEGLIFTATADFSRSASNVFYTPEKIHLIHPARVGKRADRLVAYTADPFTFPQDWRVLPNGPFVTSTFARCIEGHDFLFVSDMYGGFLAGYRFDRVRMGYVGIPCLMMNNGDPDKDVPIKMWVDANGDGLACDNEYHPSREVNQYSMSFFVDEQGNVWRGTRGQGVFFWRMKGLDKHGVPQYDAPRLWPLPENFRDAKRVWYDTTRDELFLAGNSNVNPDVRDTWWAMCGTIVCCRGFMKQVGEGRVKEGWKSDLSIYIPFHVEDGSGLDHTNAKAFTVAGDYIFVVLARQGWITVYDRMTGAFVGRIEPGDTVHRQSGWADFNYAINARQLPDGTYEILVEENGFGKVLYYHWKGR